MTHELYIEFARSVRLLNSPCKANTCFSNLSYSKDKISEPILTFSRSRISKKTINFPTLKVDLERRGQTFFAVTFLIFGCIYDTHLILHGVDSNSTKKPYPRSRRLCVVYCRLKFICDINCKCKKWWSFQLETSLLRTVLQISTK